MTQWTSLSSYLGRPIRVTEFATYDCSLAQETLRDSLVMVILNLEFDAGHSGRKFFDGLIAPAPLAIVLFGTDTRAAFDLLITLLGDGRQRSHIMTKYLSNGTVEDALEDFVRATWPSEERFDEWKSYSIIVVGPSDLARIEGTVRRLCA